MNTLTRVAADHFFFNVCFTIMRWSFSIFFPSFGRSCRIKFVAEMAAQKAVNLAKIFVEGHEIHIASVASAATSQPLKALPARPSTTRPFDAGGASRAAAPYSKPASFFEKTGPGAKAPAQHPYVPRQPISADRPHARPLGPVSSHGSFFEKNAGSAAASAAAWAAPPTSLPPSGPPEVCRFCHGELFDHFSTRGNHSVTVRYRLV